jgi:hypothetical protein
MRRAMLSIHAARPCSSISKNSHHPLNSGTSSPESPVRVRRLAAPVAAVNLTVETFVAIVVSQVEALVFVLVLDFEFGFLAAFGCWTHALRLARREISSKHAAVASAGKIDPFLGFSLIRTPAPGKASGQRNFCVDGSDHSKSDGSGDLHGGRCVLG